MLKNIKLTKVLVFTSLFINRKVDYIINKEAYLNNKKKSEVILDYINIGIQKEIHETEINESSLLKEPKNELSHKTLYITEKLHKLIKNKAKLFKKSENDIMLMYLFLGLKEKNYI